MKRFFILLVLLFLGCYKTPECDTEVIGVIERPVGNNQVEKTYIFETVCL